MMKKIIFTLLLINLSTVLALEIDEKLTLRVLEVSKTKKTMLVNRGLEDGLVVGDHAKFFLTKGVIARGVVVKASPARSIWSIYRLIYPDDISKDSVVNLKISSPVKITDDKTKSIRDLYTSNPGMGEPNDIISSNQDDDEVSALMRDGDISDDDQDVIGDVKKTNSNRLPHHVGTSNTNHGLEVYSLLSLSSLAGEYSTESESFSSESGGVNFSAGVEKYFPKSQSFLRNISLKAHFSRISYSTGFGVNNSSVMTDFGAGVSYYFGENLFRTNSIMYFADVNFGMSSVSLEIQDNINESESANTSNSIDGSGSFFSLGVGAKYLFGKSFGVIGKLDYYRSASSFDIEDEQGEISSDTLTVSGPRIMFGLSYRFL